MKKTFISAKDLYEDMISGNQSFIKSENTYNGDQQTIEGFTIYRVVNLKAGKLEFHSNKFGGSCLHILGDIVSAEKTDNQDNAITEYSINVKGKNSPLILMACKR